VVDCVGIEPTT